MSSIWTEDRVKAARAYYDTGKSAGKCAAALSVDFGFPITRNSVVGLWFRQKFNGRATEPPKSRSSTPRRAKDLSKRERVVIIRPAKGEKPTSKKIQHIIAGTCGSLRIIESTSASLPPLRTVDVTPLYLSLLDLQHGQCRYPYGDKDFRFCGCRTGPGRPYCEPHQALTTSRQHLTGHSRPHWGAIRRKSALPRVISIHAGEHET